MVRLLRVAVLVWDVVSDGSHALVAATPGQVAKRQELEQAIQALEQHLRVLSPDGGGALLVDNAVCRASEWISSWAPPRRQGILDTGHVCALPRCRKALRSYRMHPLLPRAPSFFLRARASKCCSKVLEFCEERLSCRAATDGARNKGLVRRLNPGERNEFRLRTTCSCNPCAANRFEYVREALDPRVLINGANCSFIGIRTLCLKDYVRMR
jgi:hypothetical protein